jgi:hypothetical protein
LSLVLAAAAQAASPDAFKRTVAASEVDWSAGVVTAQAGSAADIRMPGPNAARPGAERRARAAAEAKLSAALHALGLDNLTTGKTASVSRIEYQSNGGVVLWLSVRFSELVPAKAAPRSLKVATMPFEFAPTLVAGGKEARVASATYGPISASPKDAIPVRRDEKGRLVLPSPSLSPQTIDSLAGSAVVIYLEKAQP